MTIISQLMTLMEITYTDSFLLNKGKLDKGFNFISYNLMDNNEYLDKGLYKVLIITEGII